MTCPVEQLLRERMGLDAATIGSGAIQRTIRLRMKSLGLKMIEEYRNVLENSRAEWKELVESVVVTETWFFRDHEPFHTFVRFVREEWFAAHPTRVLRVLSIPCSTGEEPYSLVMALLDAAIPADRFQIDGVDISAVALARARQGVYGRNSFRGKELGFRDRHFRQSKDGYVLEPSLRARVKFFEGNILHADFLRGQEDYDVVFCRNLLIYFDRPTQKRALEKIDRLLLPGGLLFVGPAEQPLALEHGFPSANIAMAFACRKRTGSETLARSASPPVVISVKKGPAKALKLPAPVMAQPLPQPSRVPPRQTQNPVVPSLRQARRTPQVSPPRENQGAPANLDEAFRLANAGKLKEAAQICETHLQQHGASAQAWYLLGLVRDAGNDASSIDCYRKALYLEPNHYESLLQMALLAERNGDAARARTYRNRAERLKRREIVKA